MALWGGQSSKIVVDTPGLAVVLPPKWRGVTTVSEQQER